MRIFIAFGIALSLGSVLWAQSPADSAQIPLSSSSASLDSMPVVSDAVSPDSSVITPSSSASSLTQEPIQSLEDWMAKWLGNPAVASLKAQGIKYDAYDSLDGSVAVSGQIKDHQFEFSFSGNMSISITQFAKLRKAKDVSLRVGYHDRTIALKPKQDRVLLIDSLTLLMGDSAYSLQVEIWLPEKISGTKAYALWRDSMQSQGSLRVSERGFLLDSRDEQVYPWLQMGGNDWLSRYLDYGSPGAYPCSDKPDEALCRRYGREEALTVCPAGWRLPDSLDMLSLLDQWQATPRDSTGKTTALSLPFGSRFLVWEVHASDTATQAGVMLLSPWSGGTTIAPHLWRYFETFASTGEGHLGLFQMGWDEKGWMSIFDVDDTDKVHRPVRCVHSHT